MKLDILPPRRDLFGERAFLSIVVLCRPTKKKKKKNLLSELGQPMGRVKHRMGAGCRVDFILLPPAPCPDGDFVAAWLPWPTRLSQPRDPPYLCYPPAAASTWGFGTSCCRASSDSYVIERGPAQGSLLLDGVVPSGNVPCSSHGLVALTKPAETRPRRPSGWGGYRVGEHPSPLQGCAAWPWEQGKGSGMGNEALPFWWQCGITLAQKDG